MTDHSALNAAQRREHLGRMERDVLDIVIVGGGVTGCGTALDAASRGLSVALLEQRDYGAGTSSRSSKLFHGGLRYLEQFRFGLVREALSERNLMLEVICPHLVEPVSFLYPLRHRFWERLYVGAGVLLYDLLGTLIGSPLPRHRHLTRRGALRLSPALSPSSLVGAVRYWDAKVDDARHTMTVGRTAAAHGALLGTSTRVTGLMHQDGHVAGVIATDLETGERLTIRSRTVVSAAGVWTDDIQAMAGEKATNVTASKGIHIVVPKSAIVSDTGLILRTERSVLFVIPWGEYWIVGTTDTPWDLHRAHPAASAVDIQYLLSRVNSAFEKDLTREDVLGVYAGLRPLLAGESDDTSRLSREHAVLTTETGLISVAGGKYTTYRVMARDAVNAAAARLSRPVPVSVTETLKLVGENREYEIDELIESRPSLGTRLGRSRYSHADVVYAVTHEGALHLDDVLTRRTRVSIETRDRGTEVAADVARLMAVELGWDPETIHREIDHYLARVAAERDSQTRHDDDTADAARMGAADVRTGRVD